ncbi:MAG: hypothetical protein WC712_06350 [Candidatus Brocadiia bacterium]
MAETWVWTCPRTGFNGGNLDANEKLGFYGANFADPVTVNSYQGSTHFSDDGVTTDLCSVHCNNVKYLTASTCSLNGGASASLAGLANSDATLKITLSGLGTVQTLNTRFYSYNGTTRETAPDGVTCQAAEISQANWTSIAGSGQACALGNQAPASSHSWYIALSVMPTTSGVKSAFAFAIETEYI